MKIFARVSALLLIGVLAAACGLSITRMAGELPAPMTLPGTGADSTPAPQGSMLVVVSKRGLLSVLTNDGWLQPKIPAAFTTAAYCLPANTQVSLGVNTAWAQCSTTTITSAAGQEWSNASLSTDGRLVLGPASRAAMMTTTRVEILQDDGTAVHYTAEQALGQRTFPAGGAAFTPDGTLWLAGRAGLGLPALVSFDGQNWQQYGNQPGIAGLAPGENLHLLAPAKDGGLWAASDNQLFHFANGKFGLVLDQKRFALEFKSGLFTGEINDMVVLPNGDVWLATSEGIYTWNGHDLALLDRGDGLPAKDTRGLAVDAHGRIWAATAYGLALYEDGKWQAIMPATSGLSDADLVAVAVRGAPALPAPSKPAKTTTILGHIVRTGAVPLTGAEVILCDEGPGANHRHGEPLPCAEQFYTRSTHTDANGDYRFENVPIGAYTIVVEDKGTWFFAIRQPEQDWQPIVALTPGEPAHMNMGVP